MFAECCCHERDSAKLTLSQAEGLPHDRVARDEAAKLGIACPSVVRPRRTKAGSTARFRNTIHFPDLILDW